MNVTLHLTSGCQLRCRYCYASPGKLKAAQMDEATAIEAVEFAAKWSPGSCGIVFFGGEPLTRKDLIRRVVGYCRERETRDPTRFHFKVTTNGIALDDEFLDFSVKEDLFVAISHDGVRESHDRHRVTPDGGGTFDVVDAAARRLLARRPYSPVLMVVSPETVERFADSVEYLVGLGFRYVISSLHYAGNWGSAGLRRLKRQYKRLAEIYERWMREERKFYFSPFEVKLASHIHGAHYRQERCELGRRQLSVSPDGRIFPCVQFVQDGTDETFALGDIRAGLDPARCDRVFEMADREEDACKSCAVNLRCNHTCGCLNWQSTGSVERVSPTLCAHERMLLPITDALGARLYKGRSAFFLQKHYNAVFPLLSLIEDQEDERSPLPSGSRPK
ncbi:MAG: radical SAM protein [Planctomycetota bacterium]|mgnify:CR=1 FL=1